MLEIPTFEFVKNPPPSLQYVKLICLPGGFTVNDRVFYEKYEKGHAPKIVISVYALDMGVKFENTRARERKRIFLDFKTL